MATITVNKIEAACRQIDVAIKLLFNSEDPVPIHTLSFASFHLLKDLVTKKGVVSEFETELLSTIRPEMQSAFLSEINKPSNFLKHADRDPDAILENIAEEANDYILLWCIEYYKDLGYQWTPEMSTFSIWFKLAHIDLYIAPSTPVPEYEKLLTLIDKLDFKTRIGQLKAGKEMLEIFIEEALPK